MFSFLIDSHLLLATTDKPACLPAPLPILPSRFPEADTRTRTHATSYPEMTAASTLYRHYADGADEVNDALPRSKLH